MPETQEFVVQKPDLTRDRFFVEKKGQGFQTWVVEFGKGDSIRFFYEDEQQWREGTIDRWLIDDGSGNAPGTDAHYFVRFMREGLPYGLDLYEGLRVEIEVPSDEELRQAPKFCEELIAVFGGMGYAPPEYAHCNKDAQLYVSSAGDVFCFCEEHKPKWAATSVNDTQTIP